MWVIRVACAISLFAGALMVGSAIAVGFAALVVPIVLAELALLAAAYVLVRELDQPDDAKPQPRVAARRGRAVRRPAARAVPEKGAGPRSLVGRTGA